MICAVLVMFLGGCGPSAYQPPLRPVAYPEDENPTGIRTKTAVKNEQSAVRAVHMADPSKLDFPEDAIVQNGADRNRKKPAHEFPPNLGQWLPEDFLAARRLRNFRLKEAVRELGPDNEYNPDAEFNAQLLAKLLDAPPTEAPVAPPRPASRGYDDFDEPVQGPITQMPGLAVAIVDALGANGTPAARDVLKQILLGKQHSDVDDRTLATAVLRTLVEHRDEENERILLAVLAVPDSIRPAGRGQLSADQLHEDCLRLVRPIATPEFRLKMAQRAGRGVSSPAARQRLLAMLLSQDRANVGAQVELATAGQLDQNVMPAIERQLGQVAQSVLEQLLAGKSAVVNRSRSRNANAILASDEEQHPSPAFDELLLTAGQLWRDDFAKALCTRLDSVENLQNELALLSLMACVPNEVLRHALLERWKKNWVDDAQIAQGSVIVSSAARDPGLTVLFQEMLREPALTKVRPVSSRLSSDSPQAQRIVAERTAQQAWHRGAEKFVRGLADRFAELGAAQLQSEASDNPSHVVVGTVDEFNKLLEPGSTSPAVGQEKTTPAVAAFIPADWKLSADKPARLKCAFHLSWPSDLSTSSVEFTADYLMIRFLRLQTEGELNATAHFYEKQLKPSPVTRALDNGLWVDAIQKLDEGRVRCVNVLISRADSEIVPRRGANEKLQIDILGIEMHDPQQ